jgi:hypothetical protein
LALRGAYLGNPDPAERPAARAAKMMMSVVIQSGDVRSARALAFCFGASPPGARSGGREVPDAARSGSTVVCVSVKPTGNVSIAATVPMIAQ